jgi:hypothetical protein
MKLLSVFIALLFSLQCYAGGPEMVVYKAKYVLRNGETVTGSILVIDMDEHSHLDDNTHTNKFCNDLEFQRMINTYFYNERHQIEFTVYKNLYNVKYNKSAALNQPNGSPMPCMFSDSSSLVSLNLDSVKYTVFLSAEIPDWHPEISFQVFDDRTSRRMQDNEVLNFTSLYHDPVPETPGGNDYHVFDGYLALNYNKDISFAQLKKELERISPEMYALELQLVREQKIPGEKYYREKERIAGSIMSKLRPKGIILIRIIEIG